MEIVAIVPAAGRGQRLAPYPLPKELFPIGYQEVKIDGKLHKRPKVVSQYLLEALAAVPITRLFFVIGSGKLDIIEYYRNGENYGFPIAYIYQTEPKGMPYALDLVTPYLKGNEIVLMGMPDTIFEPRTAFIQLVEAHQVWCSDLTLGLFKTDHPQKFGMVGLDKQNNIIEIEDKPSISRLKWMWGIVCWGPRFTSLLHEVLETQGEDISNLKGREVVLSDIIDIALCNKLQVKGLTFEGGRY
ncbi:MAG: sugar phosphate nucleotidyltransferase, partial [Candidatus Methanomethylicaceae archaeon]